MSIVQDLQSKAIDSKERVVGLLRMAKMVATKLDQVDAIEWIDRELNGYEGLSSNDLPKYRQIEGTPKAYNPMHGWQPINFKNADLLRKLSCVPLGMPLGAIEEMICQKDTENFIFPYPPELRISLAKSIGFNTDVHCELSAGVVFNVIDAVRNLILDWSLELEKKGIVGEGMFFTESEKETGQAVTQVFMNSHIGVVGSATGGLGQVAFSGTLDADELRPLLVSLSDALPAFPADQQTELKDTIQQIKTELEKKDSDPARLREMLGSVQRVCEGAGGSLLAQGAATIIARLLQ